VYRKELRLWINLYHPSVKLANKVRVGSNLRRVYSPAHRLRQPTHTATETKKISSDG
jgi:hypothetical protein